MKIQEKNTLQPEVKKAVYEKPEIEVIEMEHEGSILAGSGNAPDWGDNGGYDGF